MQWGFPRNPKASGFPVEKPPGSLALSFLAVAGSAPTSGWAEGCGQSPLCPPAELHGHTPLSGALCRNLNKRLPPADPINLHYRLPQPICPMFLLSPSAPKVAITLLQVKELTIFCSRWTHSVYILFLSLTFLGKLCCFVPEEQLGLATRATRWGRVPGEGAEPGQGGPGSKREGGIQGISSGSPSQEGHFRQPASLRIEPSARRAPAELSAHLLPQTAFNFSLLLILLLLWTLQGGF